MSSLESQEPVTGESRVAIMVEIVIVFAVMFSVTYAARSADLIGAGSIAIWCGIITATVLMMRRKTNWRDLGLRLPKGGREWALSIGLTVAVVATVFVFMALVLEPVMAKLGLKMAPDASDRFDFFLGKPYVFIGFLIGVIWFGAALGEEMYMRGFFLNRLADLFGHGVIGWSLALVLHATVFGAMHAYQGLAGMIATGIVGFIFGIYYLIGKRRLFPLVLAHGIINTIGMVAFYVSDGAIT